MFFNMGIASIVIGIIIAITPYLWRRFFARPELTIEIKDIHGSSWQEGISNKNVVIPEGYIDGNNAIYFFRVKIQFKLVVRNSSPHTAYYPTLIIEPTMNLRIDKFNSLKPLLSTEEVELKGEYVKLEECKGAERTPMHEFPQELKDVRMLLEYKNALKTKTYTLYTHSAETKNFFLYRKPKSFKALC